MSGLTVRLQEIEPELRAAIVSEQTAQTVSTGEGTAEEREMPAMVDRASVGAIFAAVVEHRATEGPEAELQKHLGLSGNQVPLGMLVEHRAVTPAPADVGATQARSSLAFSRRAQARSWASINRPWRLVTLCSPS